METERINLLKYRGANSTLYTGRPQGKQARKELKLDKKDKESNTVSFIIPKGTTSFNPSFYLGLLYESIKKLGITKFDAKYSFQFEDDNPVIQRVLRSNLEDGRRSAINIMEGKSGLKKLFN